MADGADVAYSFPMLSSKKIVGYLGDNNIHVSEQVSYSCKVTCRLPPYPHLLLCCHVTGTAVCTAEQQSTGMSGSLTLSHTLSSAAGSFTCTRLILGGR